MAFGPKVEAAIEEMLGPVCGRGLNSVLVDVLGLVQQNIPGLAPKVHSERLECRRDCQRSPALLFLPC